LSDEFFKTGKGGKNVDRDSLTLTAWWWHPWRHSLNGSLAGWLKRNIYTGIWWEAGMICWRVW